MTLDSETGRPEMPTVSKGTRPRPSGRTATDLPTDGDDRYGPERVRKAIARQVAAKVRCISQLYRNVRADQEADAVAEGFASVMSYWWDRYGGRFPIDLDFDLAVKHGKEVALARLRKEVRRRSVETQYFQSLLRLAAPNDADLSMVARSEQAAVRSFVVALAKPSRTVVEGRYWNNQSWKDIAAIAGVSVRTAHRLHDDSLRQLRYWLRRSEHSA